MRRRGRGRVACALWLVFACACGKSEPGTRGADVDDNGGTDSPSSAAGSTSAGGGASGTSGSAGGASGSAGGASVSSGGSTAVAGASGGSGGESGEPGGGPSVGGAPSCSGYYRACGCGCCATSGSPGACIYSDLGQNSNAIIAEDAAKKHDLQACAAAGCSLGRDYFCCTAPPVSNDGASYSTSLAIGGVDRIRLHKMSTDCSTLVLQQSFPENPVDPEAFPVEVPAGWKLETLTSLPCISSAVGPRAIGAIGKFSLRVLGDACVVDAHLSAFFANEKRELNTVRFDADGVAIDIPISQCH
jgi:hypothetical protein